MTEPLIISRQRTTLQDLHTLVADRARLAPQLDRDFRDRNEAAEKEFQESTHTVITRFEGDKEAAQKEFQDAQVRVAKRFEKDRATQDRELQDSQRKITAQFDGDNQAAKSEQQKTRAASMKAFDLVKSKAQGQAAEGDEQIAETAQECKRIRKEAVSLLRTWRQDHDFGPVPDSKPDRIYQDAFRWMQEALPKPQELVADLAALSGPGLFKGQRPFILVACLLVGSAILGAVLGGADNLVGGLGIGAAVGLGLSLFIVIILYSSAKSKIQKAFLPLLQAIAEVDLACEKATEQVRATQQKTVAAAQKRFEVEQQEAAQKFQERLAAVKERRDTDLTQTREKYEKAVADTTQRRDTDLRVAHEKYQKLRAEIYERYETDSHQIHERHYKQMTESKLRYEKEWQELIARWHNGLAQVQAVSTEVSGESSRLFPDWSSPAWNNWTPPATVPPGIHFGDYKVDLAAIKDGIPTDERLKPRGPTQFSFPALLSFPRRCSMVVKSDEQGRAQTVELLQAVMLRYLTTLPPGKVRFTIIDPVGLGENFATFMHLADYDEHLVTSRIWTELSHIEQRLSDLTAHMENVIQKYLRNQYETIEEYNAQAGEVAEPFRIAVIANFPNNFGAEAARRLVSIVSSGARCGVYALIGVDTTQEFPLGFNLVNLEQSAASLEWKDGRFIWKDPDFEQYPLQVDAPPPAEFCTSLLNVIGAKARDANRVEVPFDFIAPPREQWWTGDTRGGVNIALGRAGATKRQHMQLGKGTAQHVLVSGKTGSGKSTLLHALITNLSLLYSPDEIELYLIDFKKGVEFKTYAVHKLPHARVVAIESDREFGLSVLQRLDAELKLRGERFREAGAQDLKSYRDAVGDVSLPRIMLIVDEFQEFFLEDDKVSQEAAQLLDRLVRQGRAFGLHVLLGSQTLGGAYTLARSTIDQMAVRIALQCSEADAQLILSDDNSAARLLSRPGEAIYNDANGLVEGNNPFQVVWLPEPRREEFLELIRDMNKKRNGTPRPQVIFEGNAPAELPKNHLLHQFLTAPAWPANPLSAQAWLGEAMAIKDPTAAAFRRQSGSNLLLIGQQDEAARGIMATTLISLAAQQAPADESNRTGGARFYVLDGSPADTPNFDFLARLARLVPHPIQVVGWRELPTVIAELAEEVERRQKSNEVEGASIYLFIYSLQRFRDLRREEDDFSFSSSSEEQKPSPAKQFASLLREGAGLGVHTIVWCDTVNNMGRSLDRQALREFEMRVLFQMSATDSSNLIDTPVAARLGQHRALFHSEEEAKLEKFRPYGLPPEEWLSWMKEQLKRKQTAPALAV